MSPKRDAVGPIRSLCRAGEMKFLRSRSEHLADHLREAITLGKLSDPLPTTREWALQLGVSWRTLQVTLNILKREGWIRSRPRRGLSLARRPFRRRVGKPASIVRWMMQSLDYRRNVVMHEVLGMLSQCLIDHHIGLHVEACDDARIKAIRKEGPHPGEMLALVSLYPEHQALFTDFPNALQIGPPVPGIPLPYVTIDVDFAWRHAVFGLLRRGFERINTIIGSDVVVWPKHGYQMAAKREFQKIMATAPRPIHGELIGVSMDENIQYMAVQRLAARIRGRQGLITLAPLAPVMVMMALMNRGLRLPGEVEVVAINCSPNQANTVPPIYNYPFPIRKLCDAICRAAIHCFEQGAVPAIHRVIPLTMVAPYHT